MFELHEKLLSDWSKNELHQQQVFVSDGIIDFERWSKAPRKVLFLMKEAYGEPNTKENWDFCSLLRTWGKPKFKMLKLISYWAYALHHSRPGYVPPFTFTEECACDSFLASALVNVKKSNGKSTSQDDDLIKYVHSDGGFLLKQIELIDPQIVVCGNIWRLVCHLWPNREEIYDRVWQCGKYLFIDATHPANRYPNWLDYYAVAALFQGALSKAASI